MKNFFKYTCLGLSAAYITVVLFWGMLNLLKKHNHLISSQTLDFTISYIKPEEDLSLKNRKVKKPQKKPKATKPPAMPRLQITNDQVKITTSPDTFNYGYNLKAFEYHPMSGPSLHMGEVNADEMGGVRSAMPPIYPPSALFRDIEGWVEVLISINQLGLVTEVVVVNAEPADIFDDAAINAVMKWAYYPKTTNGIPLPYQITQTIEFKIDQPVE